MWNLMGSVKNYGEEKSETRSLTLTFMSHASVQKKSKGNTITFNQRFKKVGPKDQQLELK